MKLSIKLLKYTKAVQEKVMNQNISGRHVFFFDIWYFYFRLQKDRKASKFSFASRTTAFLQNKYGRKKYALWIVWKLHLSFVTPSEIKEKLSLFPKLSLPKDRFPWSGMQLILLIFVYLVHKRKWKEKRLKNASVRFRRSYSFCVDPRT